MMTVCEKWINRIILALGVLMIAYYLLLGIAVRFGQSLQFMWLLCGAVCIARYAYWKWVEKTGRRPKKRVVALVRGVVCVLLAFFLVVEGVIFFGGAMQPKAGLDAIIVLGARVNGREPSGALRNRIEVAAQYLEANPDTIAVVSGGQGRDEEISEAQCMQENLVAKGIDPARIIMEERSTDTVENLRFSMELMPAGVEHIGIVTNDFHIFRSLALARGLDMENVHGVPVATSLFSMPHYMMREFASVVVGFLQGDMSF